MHFWDRLATRRGQSPALLGGPTSISEPGDAASQTPVEGNRSSRSRWGARGQEDTHILAGGLEEAAGAEELAAHGIPVVQEQQQDEDRHDEDGGGHRWQGKGKVANEQIAQRVHRPPCCLPPAPSRRLGKEQLGKAPEKPVSPVLATPKASLYPTSLCPYENRNKLQSQSGSAPSRTAAAGTGPAGTGLPVPRCPPAQDWGSPLRIGTPAGCRFASAPAFGNPRLPLSSRSAPLSPSGTANPPPPLRSGPQPREPAEPRTRTAMLKQPWVGESFRRHSTRPPREATAEADPARRPPPPGPTGAPARHSLAAMTMASTLLSMAAAAAAECAEASLGCAIPPGPPPRPPPAALPAARAPAPAGRGREGRGRAHMRGRGGTGSDPAPPVSHWPPRRPPPAPIGCRRDRLHSPVGTQYRRLPWRRGGAGPGAGPGAGHGAGGPDTARRPPGQAPVLSPPETRRGQPSTSAGAAGGPAPGLPEQRCPGGAAAGSCGHAGCRSQIPHGAARTRVSGQGTTLALPRSWGGKAGLGYSRLCPSPAGSALRASPRLHGSQRGSGSGLGLRKPPSAVVSCASPKRASPPLARTPARPALLPRPDLHSHQGGRWRQSPSEAF